MTELVNQEYGFLYAIQSLDLIKIGVAKNIENRINTMRLNNPHGCEVVFSRRSTAPYTLERQMHRLLADKALGREWFRVTLKEVRAAANIARLETIRSERAIKVSIQLALKKNPGLAQRVRFKEHKSSGIKWLEANVPPI